MSTINYAIELVTERTDKTNTSFGLQSGVFRWITGRPSFNGTSPYPKNEDTTDNTNVWYEGWILQDQISSTSRKVDISVTGDYGTFSSFNFSISNRNDALIWDYIYNNNIYFTNREVKFYVVIDSVFYQIWNGVIVNNPYDEVNYEFNCIDKFKKIHKMIPPNVIDKTTFPGSSSDSQGESIPVTIGDVTYAKLQTITNEPIQIGLSESRMTRYNSYLVSSAACTSYRTTDLFYPELDLYTREVSFVEDELVDHYIYVAKGGGETDTDQLIRVIGNDATTESFITTVKINCGFDFVTEEVLNQRYVYDPVQGVGHSIFYFRTPVPNNSWLNYTLDFANNGLGMNQILIDMYAHSGTLTIRTGSHTGPIISKVVLSNNILKKKVVTVDIDKQYEDNVIVYFYFQGVGSSCFVQSIQPTHNLSDIETWWFSIINMPASHITSENSIKEYVTDSEGVPLLYIYDEATKLMEIAPNIILNKDESITGALGHPEFSLYTSRMQKDGSVKYMTPVVPKYWEVSVTDNTGYIELKSGDRRNSITHRNSGVIDFDLCNRDQNEYLLIKFPNGVNKNIYHFSIKLAFPEKYIEQNFDSIYCALDMYLSASNTVRVFGKYTLVDAYDNDVDLLNTDDESDDITPDFYYPLDEAPVSMAYDVNLLPDDYYKNGGSKLAGAEPSLWSYIDKDGNDDYKQVKSLLQLNDSIMNAIKDGVTSNTVKIDVYVTSVGGNDFPFDVTVGLRQCGFIGYSSINPSSDNFYVRLKGETLDEGATETNSVYTAFRLMLETYDGIDTSDINYNNLLKTRSDWPVGRQLVDRKSSFDYIKELCSQSFVCCYPDRTGKRTFKAWLDDDTIEATISQDDIIRNSIRTWKNTEVANLFNDFRLWYNFNPATSKADSSILVTNADKSTFPLETDMQTNPTWLETWKTYVGGLSGTSYADASIIWLVCHESYVRAQCIQPLPQTLQDLVWYNNSSIFNGLNSDPGSVTNTSPGASTSDSAYKFLMKLCEWTTRQKSTVEFSMPLNTTNISLELLDKISFTDIIFTNNSSRTGWITSIEVDTKLDRINYEITLEPRDLIVDNVIDERGILLNDDTHDEGEQDDQVKDGQDRITYV